MVPFNTIQPRAQGQVTAFDQKVIRGRSNLESARETLLDRLALICSSEPMIV